MYQDGHVEVDATNTVIGTHVRTTQPSGSDDARDNCVAGLPQSNAGFVIATWTIANIAPQNRIYDEYSDKYSHLIVHHLQRGCRPHLKRQDLRRVTCCAGYSGDGGAQYHGW